MMKPVLSRLYLMRMSKIDFHVHITPPEISGNWQKYAEKELYFALLSQSPRNRFAGAESVIAMLDESGFDQAVVFGFAFKNLGLCRLANDYVIDSVRQFPDRLIGFMSVSPNDAGMEKEIDRCHSAGLVGVGEIFPEGQGISIDDPQQTRALHGACLERNLPLIVHANEPVGHSYPGKTTVGLRQLERFIENSPGLRVVLAHWGGGLLFYESMPELREKFRNVYYDTAATPFLYDEGIYRTALVLGLYEKILFGSDFPLLAPSRYLSSLAILPPPVRDRILGGNAEKILGIPVESPGVV
ncbi:MAG: amidohydrolase [Treponema sp.]|jgi:predicted TIM-barrel fold metal-dependent hydrolase|nr:amidohydrolase [Treponema sp.]